MFYLKKIFILIVVIATLTSCRKDGVCVKGNNNTISENRSTAVFDGIDAEGSLKLFITEDSIQNIRIEAESNIMPLIKTEVKNGKLHIYTSGCIRRMNQITVWLNVKNLNFISLNGSGSIETLDTLHGTDLTVQLHGSGDAYILSKFQKSDFSIDGSGNIEIKGTGEQTEFAINGSGKISAFNFLVKSAKASINGSGSIEVNSSDDLDVEINGSGNVYYKGRPRMSVQTSGSGKVLSR